ncbi:MAG TPA: HAD family hydrolase [Oxalicibacterium sp.]|nr:HAD family hydrolase [Oxalicibacterium sp.]
MPQPSALPATLSSDTPIRAILFDLDDTLWPLEAVILRAETALHDWLGLHAPGIPRRFSIAELRALRDELAATDPRYRFDLWALRHATLTHACTLCGEDAARMEQAMAVFSEARNAVTPFDDVVPALALLGERYLLGSVSNGFADLQTIGLAPHFRVSLAAHQFGSAKPDPEIFLAACDALSVAPHETLYVGDDPLLDVQGAQNAGLHAVWMNRFARTLPGHIVPAASCITLHEVHDWLNARHRTS